LSFFATLTTELVHDVIFSSRESAKTTSAEWIEIFYTGKRMHSTMRQSSKGRKARYDEATDQPEDPA
jgi:hypothetical protein